MKTLVGNQRPVLKDLGKLSMSFLSVDQQAPDTDPHSYLVCVPSRSRVKGWPRGAGNGEMLTRYQKLGLAQYIAELGCELGSLTSPLTAGLESQSLLPADRQMDDCTILLETRSFSQKRTMSNMSSSKIITGETV